jgi:L-lactate dehydrogenase (cytochrome)
MRAGEIMTSPVPPIPPHLLRRFPSFADIERAAIQRLPRFLSDFLLGGANDEVALRENRRALDAIKMLPRFGITLDDLSTEVTVMGQNWAAPIGVAPVGYGGAFWPGAELALATSAEANHLPFILSTMSITPYEAIVKAAPSATWFQLYPFSDWRINEDLLGKLSAAGVKNLVITLDLPVYAKRNRDMRHGIDFPMPVSLPLLLDIACHPAWALATATAGAPLAATLLAYLDPALSRRDGLVKLMGLLNMTVTWEHIARFRKLWPGKLVLKGLLHPEDARRAVAAGADGIVVSNHGGRQLDAAPAAIDALPDIATAVGQQIDVMLDSGIRSGLDITKALARGAKMTFAGRPFYAAVAAAGLPGADLAVGLFRSELINALSQLGVTRLGGAEAFAGALIRCLSRDAAAGAS